MIFGNEDTFDYKILFSLMNKFSNQKLYSWIFYGCYFFGKILLCHLHDRKYNLPENCFKLLSVINLKIAKKVLSLLVAT